MCWESPIFSVCLYIYQSYLEQNAFLLQSHRLKHSIWLSREKAIGRKLTVECGHVTRDASTSKARSNPSTMVSIVSASHRASGLRIFMTHRLDDTIVCALLKLGGERTYAYARLLGRTTIFSPEGMPSVSVTLLLDDADTLLTRAIVPKSGPT